MENAITKKFDKAMKALRNEWENKSIGEKEEQITLFVKGFRLGHFSKEVAAMLSLGVAGLDAVRILDNLDSAFKDLFEEVRNLPSRRSLEKSPAKSQNLLN